jgi:hypothetical protein
MDEKTIHPFPHIQHEYYFIYYKLFLFLIIAICNNIHTYCIARPC